jgi:hypothetical protein
MAEHQRRYVVRWLKERLTGRPERDDLLYELKRWLYEHHILIVHDRLLKRLIVKAGQDVEGSLTDGVIGAFGDATLDNWSRLLAQHANDHRSLHGSVNLSRLRRKDGRKKRPSERVGRIVGDFGEFAPSNESHRELCAIE